MIEPRIYRAAFLPALLAVVLAMFSLESRPDPLPQGLPADVLFDGRLAEATLRTIVEREPDRRAGSVGDLRSARFVRDTLRRRGFSVTFDDFDAEGERLANVVGLRAGASQRQIVVIAARDAASVPDATGSAADTAALLEFARVYKGRPSDKTLVLASVDGSTLGEAGARRLVAELGNRELTDSVIVISDLGAPRRRGALIVPWANDPTRVGVGLERTVADSLRAEVKSIGAAPSPAGQLSHLAFPLGIGAQGVLLDEGLDAIRISGSGQLPPPVSETGLEDVDRDRLGPLGRGALRTISTLDKRPKPDRGAETYVTAVRQILPGWVVTVLVVALLAPALVASIDGFARARRRREPVARWLAWLFAGLTPFLLGLALAELLVFAGAVPDTPMAPIAPDAEPLDATGGAAMGAVFVTVLLGWLLARPWLTGGRTRAAAPAGAGTATALALSLAALALWFVNPFAALMVVPAVHLWMLATVVDPPPARRIQALMIAGGLVLPVTVAVYYLLNLDLNPLDGAWYLFLLVTGHQVGLATTLLGCTFLALLGATASLAITGRAEGAADEGPPSVRGPSSYAGPGSLGGTGSALPKR